MVLYQINTYTFTFTFLRFQIHIECADASEKIRNMKFHGLICGSSILWNHFGHWAASKGLSLVASLVCGISILILQSCFSSTPQFSGRFNKFTIQNDITWLANTDSQKKGKEGEQNRAEI